MAEKRVTGEQAGGDRTGGAGGAGEQGVLDRYTEKYPALGHMVAAGKRYTEQNGDYYAAGITYFSVLALFPIIMVAVAVAGFVLASNPEWMDQIRERIVSAVQGDMGDQLTALLDKAVASRGTVGVIGLVGALYAGLGWMANLRMALTEQWKHVPDPDGFIATKRSDFVALVGLGGAMILSFALAAVSSSGLVPRLLELAMLDELPGVGYAIRAAAVVISLAASWLLFTWVIAKLPRVRLPLRKARKAGLLTAIVFEAFKYIASFYLKIVLTGPAGATFGPILGIMVFAFFTARIILFATAWAATDPANAEFAPAVPDPIIRPTYVVEEGVSGKGVLAAVGAGVVVAVGLGGWARRRPRG